jgi:hypothetical protein
MAQNRLDRLVDQLLDTNDPRKQKNLIGQIERLEDPRSITALAALYNKADVDPGVRKAAAEVLREFRRTEMKLKGGPQIKPVTALDELREQRQPAARVAMTLRPIRRLLVILLIISLVLNGLLVGAKALGLGKEDPDAPIAGPDTPTDRADLTGQAQDRLTKTRRDAEYLRKRWQEVQSKVPLTCKQDAFSDVLPQRPTQTDARIYPDWYGLNAAVNAATRLLIPLRDEWLRICQKPTDPGNYNVDAAAKIVETDNVVKAVEQADQVIEKWQNSPAPTYYPSPTPTVAPPTETPVPTVTPIPSNTPIPTAGPSPTPVTPTLPPTLTVAATAVPPTATQIPSIRLTDFKLATLKSYSYRVTIRYTTQVSLLEQQTGTLRVQVSREPAALTPNATASYTVEVSETGKTFANVKNPLIVSGLIDYLLKDGKYYADTVKSTGKTGCVVTAATDKQTGALQALEDYVLKIPDVVLTRQNRIDLANGIPVRQYKGELANLDPANPNLKAAVDAYIDPNTGLPLRVTISTTESAATGTAPTGPRLVDYSYTFELLATQVDLSAIRTPACKAG